MKQKKLLDVSVSPKNIKVRSYCSLKISFSLDFDIPQDSLLNFRFRGGRNNKNDWYFLQVNDPNMNGFAQISIIPSISLIPLVITGKELIIKYIITEKLGIKKNSKIELRIVKTLAQSLVEMNKKIDIYLELPDKNKINFSNPPTLNLINDKFNHITILCPSIAIVNQKFKIILRIEDKYKNLVKDFRGKIELQYLNMDDALAVKIKDVQVHERFNGLFRIVDFSIPHSGIYLITCYHKIKTYISNPIKCVQIKPKKRLYWGYIHGHTNKSDGVRDPNEYFHNMIDAGLDFGTNTEHDHINETSDEDFNEIRTIVKKFYEENVFVSFFGYEYGKWFTGHGDICIYHYDDGIPIFRSEINKYNSPLKLNKNLRKYRDKILLISHHSALRAGYRNWDYFDNSIEKLVEIYSTWGNQECSFQDGNPLPPRYKFYGYGKHALKRGAILEKKGSFVRDALQKGYKLGFTAGGDDHFGLYPSGEIDPDDGLYPPGIMAIWAEKLTKKSIWNALNDRKCYGTTGPRVIIEFYLDSYFMGDIIELNKEKRLAKTRILNIGIISPINIIKLEIIRNNGVFHKILINRFTFVGRFEDNVPLKIIFLTHISQKERFVFYYLRFFLENDHMAWSSPIWVIQN